MNSGVAPTDLNARTGLFTPPTRTCSARRKSFTDLANFIDEEDIRRSGLGARGSGLGSAELVVAGAGGRRKHLNCSHPARYARRLCSLGASRRITPAAAPPRERS